MISVLIYSHLDKELRQITDEYKCLAAKCSDEQWHFEVSADANRICSAIESSINLDMACIDVTAKDGIDFAEKIHGLFSGCIIVLISDETVSPIKYIKPSIHASALLLRPISEEHIIDGIYA